MHAVTAILVLLQVIQESHSFVVPQKTHRSTSAFFATPPPTKDGVDVDKDTDSAAAKDVEGLPWWWENVWDLDMMKKGQPGNAIIFGDSANVLRTNIEQIYGG